MRKIFFILFLFACNAAFAAKVSGTVSDTKGYTLAFASITVKGTSKGVVANNQGRYSISLENGSYVLVCHFIGYQTVEKKVTTTGEDLIVDFQLPVQELTMEEVVIKRGEDPALEIMRQTIRKRETYNNEVDSLTVDVYIKSLLRSRSVPSQFFGQKVDKSEMQKEGFDSAGRGILFLSESVTKVSLTKPDKVKFEVVSSHQSGGGIGLSLPFFINFYTNNVAVFNGLNPRGFISPISDNAFHYYKFHYEGNFFEGKEMIDRIRVTPKRKNEPLFDGYIQIVDGSWRIHSLDLITTTDYQLQMLDTLRITQLHAPVNEQVWRTQSQVVYLSIHKLGLGLSGNFLNVYSNYNLNPGFQKKYFSKILMSYDSTYNKKDSNYWSAIRPVPLEVDETKDFKFKDSLSRVRYDSMYSRYNLDSLRKARQKIKVKDFFKGGVRRDYYSSSGISTYKFDPLLKQLEYNTVEGVNLTLLQSLDIRPRNGNANYLLDWNTRYGFNNQHLNSWLSLKITPKKDGYRNRFLEFSGGKRVSQFNPDSPVDPFINSIYSLLYKQNYLKIYENWFGSIRYNNRFENGITLLADAHFEDRMPLENTTDYALYKKERIILPNHPYELAGIPFLRNQALVTSVTLSYQPGQHYIQFPTYKVPVGSKYPTFEMTYSKGIPKIWGSDADFDKWRFSVYDGMNFKLGGEFRYKVSIGGFINATHVDIPDFQHFNGNQTFYNFKYLNSFQLAPYYRYSNTEPFFALGHVEHHFNGLLTNKIPLFNRLKWNLVIGSNTFYVNSNNYYAEAFAGIENILKIFRVDFISAYQAQPGHNFGIRIGAGGLFGDLFFSAMR